DPERSSTALVARSLDGAVAVAASLFGRVTGAALASSRFAPRVKTKTTSTTATTRMAPAAMTLDMLTSRFDSSTVAERRCAEVAGRTRLTRLSFIRAGTALFKVGAEARI